MMSARTYARTSQSEGRHWRSRFLTRRRAAVALIMLSIVVAALTGATAAVVLYVRSQDSATPVAVADIVTAFQDNARAGATSSGPQPGVYLYDTNGEEHVDALGGATHRYPATTTITIVPTACGYRARWDALQERWDANEYCFGAEGDHIRSTASYHEFFGRGDARYFDCKAGSLGRPASKTPGTAWITACSNDTASSRGEGEVVGVERITVGGEEVDAVRFRVATTLDGSSRGQATHEIWVLPESGLVLRRSALVDSEADSILGAVTYREEYTIHLRSLEPVSAGVAGR
jgi:hypothetical protein